MGFRDSLRVVCLGLSSAARGRWLFFSFPNVETFLPLFIDDDHLRRIFRVIDIDWYGEFDEFPLPIFADNLHQAVGVEVIGAAYREIRGRSW
jgi:hypothetical protein